MQFSICLFSYDTGPNNLRFCIIATVTLPVQQFEYFYNTIQSGSKSRSASKISKKIFLKRHLYRVTHLSRTSALQLIVPGGGEVSDECDICFFFLMTGSFNIYFYTMFYFLSLILNTLNERFNFHASLLNTDLNREYFQQIFICTILIIQDLPSVIYSTL